MKTIKTAIAIAIATLSVATSARAEYLNQQTFGDTTYYQGSDGYSGYEQRGDDWRTYSDNRGNHCYQTRIGDMVTTTCK